MQLYPNLKNSSVITCPEPSHELLGWIWLGVAGIGPQEIKEPLTNTFQKKQILES